MRRSQVRGPAAWQGIYGLRPSHGAISLQGAMPLCSPLDSAGYFARDAITFQKIGKAWYGDALKTYPKLPHVRRRFATAACPDHVPPLFSTYTCLMIFSLSHRRRPKALR